MIQRIALVVLCSLTQPVFAADAWLSYPPDDSTYEWLPSEKVCEVVGSRVMDAESRLANAGGVLLESEEAHGFSACVCSAEREVPILMRAVWYNASGQFYVGRVEGGVIVLYSSLGRVRATHHSAVVACLDGLPERVFVGLHEVL